MIRSSLTEIRERAHAELLVNDTITTYILVDDYVWRRFGNELSKLTAEFIEIGDSMRALGDAFQGIGEDSKK